MKKFFLTLVIILSVVMSAGALFGVSGGFKDWKFITENLPKSEKPDYEIATIINGVSYKDSGSKRLSGTFPADYDTAEGRVTTSVIVNKEDLVFLDKYNLVIACSLGQGYKNYITANGSDALKSAVTSGHFGSSFSIIDIASSGDESLNFYHPVSQNWISGKYFGGQVDEAKQLAGEYLSSQRNLESEEETILKVFVSLIGKDDIVNGFQEFSIWNQTFMLDYNFA